MHLPKFRHQRPASIEEAVRLLGENGPQAAVVAGGTDLFPRMKYGLLRPAVVISLKGIPVSPPSEGENGALHLDALMSLADVVRSPLISNKAPLLAEAALSVGSNQVRHMATLGGNLCLETRCTYYNQSHAFQYVAPCYKRDGSFCYLISKGKRCQAVFMGDTVPALICLDAQVEIQSAGGIRHAPVADLYTGDALSPMALSGDEILRKVIIPPPAPAQGTAFTKYSIRGALEFGALSVAVRLALAEDRKRVGEARVAVSSVAAKPVRAVKAEAALTGEEPSEELLREVARGVATEVRPVMHHGFSVPFLRESLEVQAFRTLTEALKDMRGEVSNEVL